MKVVIVVLGLIFYAEFVGYFLHRLLHSDKIKWLSRNHMYHHLKDYGPTNKMRSDTYKEGARDRTNFAGLGLEYIVPISLILLTLCGILTWIGLTWYYQVFSVLGVIIWSWLNFNYMHAAYHKTDFWMLKIPGLRKWFKRARRYHDIHHVYLSDEGLMTSNYGISFFWMDRLFGTLKTSVKGLNRGGLARAHRTFAYILDRPS